MATKGTASACCLSRQELHRSIGMNHSLHMSRVFTDFNPSLGKQQQHLCQGMFYTDTKKASYSDGAGWDKTYTPFPLFDRVLRQRHRITELFNYVIYKLKQGTFKLVTTVSVQDND